FRLTESQGNPDMDPLILWLNEGPSCSSMGDLFEEIGPFYVNKDGSTLFENIFSWSNSKNELSL
ncbi:hypothetical protein Angca_009085, partial [Angiostrongylus cantonensis]